MVNGTPGIWGVIAWYQSLGNDYLGSSVSAFISMVLISASQLGIRA